MATRNRMGRQLPPSPNAASSLPTRVPSESTPVAARETRRRSSLGIGLVVFIGSLLGSLLGVAADFGEAQATFEQFRSLAFPELCVVGSNTILGDGIAMAGDWEAAFEAGHDVRVTIRGIGSVAGVEEAIAGGCVHVLAMSEPITDRQYEALTGAGIEVNCAAEIGYDVVAFVTDINNPTPIIQYPALDEVLIGGITNWAALGARDYDQPIRLLARPAGGTTEFVLQNTARWRDPDISDDTYWPNTADYTPCASNEDCLNQALSTPGSLYWVSTAWMRTQPPEYLRVVPILRGDEAPVNPVLEEVDLDEYPSALIRPLYLYVLRSPNISDEIEAWAERFLYFVRSVPGQQILERYHFYTFFDNPRDVSVPLPPPFTAGLGEGEQPPVCRAPAAAAFASG